METISNKGYICLMTMKEKFKTVMTASLDLFFPPFCSSCRKTTDGSDTPLCEKCFSQLKFMKIPYCTCCGRSFFSGNKNHLCGDCLESSWNFDRARSIVAYEDIIAGLIHELKYSGTMSGLKTFQYLSRQSPVKNDLNTADLILPVPLHIKRLRHRGFNQALLLAKSLFPDEREKIRYDILFRQTDTPSQTGLSGRQRRKNLKNAFIVKRPSEISGRNILIIDDVFTTGSTVNECAGALKKNGCRRVEILTICRAERTSSRQPGTQPGNTVYRDRRSFPT